MRRTISFLLVTLASLPASAIDVWTTPYPGIQMLRRTTSQPVVLWALVIDSCAPGIRFRATAPSEGPRVTSSFGRLVGAQMAINGDFADHDFGLNVGNSQAWPYPDTAHSGNFSVGANRIEMRPDYELLPSAPPWVSEQLGGRWTLLNDGVAQRGIDDNGPAPGGFVCAPGLRHPRTAIGLSRDRRRVFIVVADGRSSASIGMTCDELITVFQELGAHDAMGLDGGGSSTLWGNNAVINHPTDASGERTVRNHLAIFASGVGAAPHCGLRVMPVEPAQAMPVAAAALPTVVALGRPSRFTLRTPTRLFDTRTPESSARLSRGDGSNVGPLSLSSGGSFRAWSEVGVPSDASGVWLNVTAVGREVPGFLTVFPNGRPRPETSNVNFEPAQAVANATPAALGAAGQINFEAHTAVDVIADLSGSFAPTGAGLAPIVPTRVLDTRTPATPLRAGVARRVDVRAPAGASGVAATVAVIAGAQPGFLTAFPCDTPLPPTSNLNFPAGGVVANAIVSGLGGGRLCLTSSVDADVVVDVTGHFTPSAPLSYVALFPQRLLDTRATSTPYTGRVGAGQVLTLPIQRVPGMPAAIGAVVANVTVVGAAAPGFLTAYPCGGGAPEASTVNFPADRAVGALTMTAIGEGALCLTSSARAHVLVDVLGVWVAAPPMIDAGPPPVDASAPPDVIAPPDVSVVIDAAMPRDATPDASVMSDVRTSTDADAAKDPSEKRDAPPVSCGCRVGRGGAPSAVGLSIGLLAMLSARRRRR